MRNKTEEPSRVLRFFVSNGAIVLNSGLFFDNTNWDFLSSGQVADYTGLAEYDGAWFYVWDGMYQETAEGWVKHDGPSPRP